MRRYYSVLLMGPRFSDIDWKEFMTLREAVNCVDSHLEKCKHSNAEIDDIAITLHEDDLWFHLDYHHVFG